MQRAVLLEASAKVTGRHLNHVPTHEPTLRDLRRTVFAPTAFGRPKTLKWRMDRERPAAGDLSRYPLPGLLFGLHRENLTGTLTVGRDHSERRVHVRDGRVVAVVASAAIEACARILLDQGIVSQDHYAQSLMVAHDSERSQTDVLEEMGAVTDEQLARARGQHSYETMMRLFRLRRGEFTVQAQDHEYGRRSETGIHPRRIIFHGIRAAYDVERLREEMGDRLDDATFRISRDEVAHLGDYDFDDDAREMVERLCSDDCTVDMLGNSELSARRVLYTLLATEALEVRASASAVTPGRKIATPTPATTADVSGLGSYHLSRKTVPPSARRERLLSKSSSSVPPTAAPKPTAAALREKIEKTAQDLDRISYFDLLGIKGDAEQAEIERAYAAQRQMCDAAQLKALGLDDLAPVVSRMLVRLDRAYDILSNPTLRGAYLRSMSGQGGKSGSQAGRVRKRTPESGA